MNATLQNADMAPVGGATRSPGELGPSQVSHQAEASRWVPEMLTLVSQANEALTGAFADEPLAPSRYNAMPLIDESIPVPEAPPPMDRLLWRLHKGGRIAEARLRELSLGCELRFLSDGFVRWSQLFYVESGELTQRAIEKRQDYERLGWRAAE